MRRAWVLGCVGLALVRVGHSTADEPGPAATYYVDAIAGDDAETGTTESAAWKTVAQVAARGLAPGTRILLRGGQRHVGPLRLKAQAGTREAPLRIASFGTGSAVLDGGTGTGLSLESCAFVRASGLDVVGVGRKGGNDGCGVLIDRCQDVTLDGARVSGFRLCGVQVNRSARVTVANVRATENGFAGLSVGPDALSEDVTISGCVAENNPGDPKNLTNHSGNGIIVGAVRRCLIEDCVASGNGWDMPRKGNGPAGIWAWNADAVTIERCISHDNKTSPGSGDGGGFDLDGGVTNSVIQHCLAYRNAGAGFYVCQYPTAPPFGGNVIRCNVAVDNLCGLLVWAAPRERIGGCDFDHNVVVQRGGKEAFQVWEAERVEAITFRNNVFLCDQAMVNDLRPGIRFEGNCWSGLGPEGLVMSREHARLADWVQATTQESRDGRILAMDADPRLRLPGRAEPLPTDPRKLSDMPWFRLLPGSPCLGKATPVERPASKDFWLAPLGSGGPRNVGADQRAP